MAKAADTIDFHPPKAVQQAYKKGLDLKDEYGGKGLREHTIDWARHFVAGKPSDAAQARRMRAWFHRHKVDRKPGWDSPPTPGYVAHLLWGGEAGEKWAETLVEKVEASDEAAGRPSKAAKRPPNRAQPSRAKAKPKKAKAKKKTAKKSAKKAVGKSAGTAKRRTSATRKKAR